MKKYIALVLFTFVLLAGGLNPRPAAAQVPAEYYVSPAGNDAFGDGTQTWIDTDNSTGWSAGDAGPWLTINHAVDTAAGGSTIKVAAGTYKENVILTKPVTLLGPNADIDPNTGLCNPEAVWLSDNTGAWPLRTISLSYDGGPVICGITIKGFSFAGRPDVPNTAGIVHAQETSKGLPVTTDNVIIENNIFTGFANGVKSMGIYKTSGSKFLRSSGWHIRNNRFENFSGAAAMQAGSLTGSTITGNVLLNTCGGIDLDRVDHLQCSGNTLTNIVKKGINLASPSSDVTISNNRITNANTSHSSGQGGIALWVSDFTGPVNVTGNTITSCWNAVAVDDGKGDLSHNYVHINNNHFSNNTNLNIYLPAGATGVLDSTGNWFGTNNGTEIAAAVSPGVDYSPWWGADYVADAHTAAWNWYTNDSIQETIDTAADGDIIYAAKGVYDENIDINRRLTLQGAGQDEATGTILQNTADPVLVKGSPYSYKPIVVISASGVEGSPLVLKDLLIRPHQDNVTGAQLPGILPRPGTQISWLELDNVRVSGTNSPGTAEAGLLLDDFSSLDHLIVQDCTFENMAYGIIFFNNSNSGTNARYIEINHTAFQHNSIKGFYAEKLSDAVFNEVIVTDNGDTSLSPEWADPVNAGIDINLKFGDYADLTFNGLTVTGNGIGSDNGTGLAVKARGTGQDASYNSRPATLSGVTIEGGTFTGNQAGIRFGQSDKNNTNPTNITVHQAVISGNSRFDMSNVINGVTVEAIGNWWGTVNYDSISQKINGDITWDPWHLKAPFNITAAGITENSLVLQWAAGGIWKGDRYDFRYAASPLNNASAWDKAKKISGEPVPANGSQEMPIRGLKENTKYYFGLTLISGSDRSETGYYEVTTLDYKPVDNTPPAAISGLTPSPGSPAATSAVLHWTAVGDDGNTGFATGYIVKQSTAEITAGNFDAATTIYQKMQAQAAGQAESLTVNRLQPGTRYYFAVKARDENNNLSPISNVADITTANVLPAVTGIAPAAADNGEARILSFTGTNFNTSGSTAVRLINQENVLALKDITVSNSTGLTAVLPKGLPSGTYQARITNINGTSALSTVTFTLNPAPQPLPAVTNISPGMAPKQTPLQGVTVFGRSFTGATAVSLNGHTAALLTVNSDTQITIDTPALDPGEYDIRVTTAAGSNEASAVRFTVSEPVVLDAAGTEDVTTSGMIELNPAGVIPVQVTLTTADPATDSNTTGNDAGISVIIPSDTALTDSAGNPYTGVLNPPRVVKPDAEMKNTLPQTAVVIEMGNPEQQVNFSQDFTVEVTMAAGSRPYIYYRNKLTGQYELAGKSGTTEGIFYEPGGIVLGTAGDMYTIGLLLDHMSVYVAATTSLLPPPPPPAAPVINYLQTDFFGVRSVFSLDVNDKAVADIKAVSADGRLSLTIPAGTQARDKFGTPLATLTAAVNSSPPAAPANSAIIGTAYDFGPAGAAFNPPVALVYDYTQDILPTGISGENLIWAFYDEAAGAWVHLDGTIDTTRHIITAEITHFTTFAILTVPPAVFTSTSLMVTPTVTAPGEPVSITITVANNSSTAGRHTSILLINGIKEAGVPVDLAAGERRTVNFTVSRESPGVYHIEVDGLAGSFTVTAPETPSPAAFLVADLAFDRQQSSPGAVVNLSVTVTNTGGTAGTYTLPLRINGALETAKTVTLAAGESQTIVFSVIRNKPGVYQVEVSSQTGSFTISGGAGGGLNWLIAAAGFVVLCAAGLIFVLIFRRKRVIRT